MTVNVITIAEFMLPNNVRDMTEVFIRRDRRIIAGISLMRRCRFLQRRASARSGGAAAGGAGHPRLSPEEEDPPAMLTAKEREIVGMVREGASNTG